MFNVIVALPMKKLSPVSVSFRNTEHEKVAFATIWLIGYLSTFLSNSTPSMATMLLLMAAIVE